MDPTVDVDLGHGHRMRSFGWFPDRELNPQYDGVPDIENLGVTVFHPRADDPGLECQSAIFFDIPGVERFTDTVWQVEQQEPLTVSPSLLCVSCGDHGFIREGRWVPA